MQLETSCVCGERINVAHNSRMYSASSCSCSSSPLLPQDCLAMALVCCLHGAFPPEPSATCDDFFVLSCCNKYGFTEVITSCIEYMVLHNLSPKTRFSHAMLQLGCWSLDGCTQGFTSGKGKLCDFSFLVGEVLLWCLVLYCLHFVLIWYSWGSFWLLDFACVVALITMC